MLTSAHYTLLNGDELVLSKTKMRLIHNLVNTAKAFLKNGKTSHGRSFHCCFVIEHGKVKDIGFNSYKKKITYIPRYGLVKKYADPLYEMCLHAEVNAILKLGDIDFSKMCFLNIHIDKNFKCKTSKPCMNCLRMMNMVGVKECVYFNDVLNKWLTIKVKNIKNI